MNKALVRRKRSKRVEVAIVERNLSVVPSARRPDTLFPSNLAPAVGARVAVANAAGKIARINPQATLALPHGRAAETVTFQPAAHKKMKWGRAALNAASTKALDSKLPGMHESPARIGMKSDYFHLPACYALESAYGKTLPRPACGMTPAVSLLLVDTLLAGVHMHLPPCELGSIRITCNSPERAFPMQPGATSHFFQMGPLDATHRDGFRKARGT